jgi:hypothetical protein
MRALNAAPNWISPRPLSRSIALFLSLSIAFLRFWSFEAPGSLTLASTGAAMLTGAGIVLLLTALFRALDVRDDALPHYRVTVRIFLLGCRGGHHRRHDIVDCPGDRDGIILNTR